MIAQAMFNSERFFWISFSTTLQIITATQTTLYNFFLGGGNDIEVNICFRTGTKHSLSTVLIKRYAMWVGLLGNEYGMK